eukprot:5323977-Pyramimonas_sp.AAC.1
MGHCIPAFGVRPRRRRLIIVWPEGVRSWGHSWANLQSRPPPATMGAYLAHLQHQARPFCIAME